MARRFTARPQRELRTAYTLTELLIVIMIAMLLMVVSLPVLKSVMEDARPREASRILNTVIFSAKARAAATDRLVGVEFTMQAVGDPANNVYQCTQMSMCEVPELYSGDTTTARATINSNSASGSQYDLYLQDSPITTAMPPTGDSTPATAYYLTDQKRVEQGGMDVDDRATGDEDIFEIRFDYRGPWYACKRDKDNVNKFFIYVTGNLPVSATSAFMSNSFHSAPFQIRRPPVRVGNPVELPRSTCIDMTYSGVGPLGVQFGNSSALRIMFTPEGSVYNYTTYKKNMNGKFLPSDTFVTGTVHFLIGLTSKVNPISEGMMGPYNYNDPEKSNLADGNALWVSVGRGSGVVTTNENAPDPTLVTNAGDTMQQAAYFKNCRQYATAREQKGGR